MLLGRYLTVSMASFLFQILRISATTRIIQDQNVDKIDQSPPSPFGFISAISPLDQTRRVRLNTNNYVTSFFDKFVRIHVTY